MLRWIKGDDGKLVLLDADNVNQYVGKKVKLRSPLYCTSDKICSKCAGELYYRLNMNNVGLVADRIASTIMQKSMKQLKSYSCLQILKNCWKSHNDKSAA